MKNTNAHTSRESWLRAATEELRPDFEKLGYRLPEKIRFAIAFTSTGKRGHLAGECWHPESSDDQHYEVIIRADISDPVEVLGVLVHEVVHTLLPSTVKHGKEFKNIAQRIGLEGAMRHTQPTPLLRQRLQAIAANLGPLPHAKLNFKIASDVPKKQQTRHLKAECGATGCGYLIQLSAKWAKAALPICPMNPKHGKLVCVLPDETGEEEDNSQSATRTNLSQS
jgi:hypothetical protein